MSRPTPQHTGRQFRCPVAILVLSALMAGAPPAAAGDLGFPVPVQVLRTTDIPAPPGFEGRQLLEVRLAPGPRDLAGDASSVLHVAALVAGSPGTTLLTGRLGAITRPDINALPEDIVGRIGGFAPVAGLVNAQAFSVGGGCAGNASGSDTIFPIVRNLRWHNVRVNAAGSTVEGPFGPPTVHSIDCATTPDRSTVYYFVVNGAAPARGELWRQDASGLSQVGTPFTDLRSPFAGGVRPSIVYGPAHDQLTLQYLTLAGRFDNKVFGIELMNLLQACESGMVSPPPTTFTTVWEGRLLRSYRPGATGIPARFAVGDFDRNGVAEAISHAANGCSLSVVKMATAGGGNGYNWVGYSASADPTRAVGGLMGATRYVEVNPVTGQIEPIPDVPVASGGPIDSVPIREAATSRSGVMSAQSGLLGEPFVLMHIVGYVYLPDGSGVRVFDDGYERVGLGAVTGGNQ